MALNVATRVEQTGPNGGAIEHRVSVEDASASFTAKATAALSKLRAAKEVAERH